MQLCYDVVVRINLAPAPDNISWCFQNLSSLLLKVSVVSSRHHGAIKILLLLLWKWLRARVLVH